MNNEMTEYENFELMFELAETVVIARGDMNIDPQYQMREQMDHSIIDDYADNIDKLPPVRVFECETACRSVLILVDGFHRFFAHERADIKDLKAKVIKGTKEQALKYAMVANFAHLKGGTKPTKESQRRAIDQLCNAMIDEFGYDSKRVVPALRAVGVSSSESWLSKCTAEIRKKIDDKRDSLIMELHGAGKSQRDIAEAAGCSVGTVNSRIKSVQNQDSAEIELPVPASDEEYDPSIHGFLEDLDDSPTINPADAQSRVLAKFESDLDCSDPPRSGKAAPKSTLVSSEINMEKPAPESVINALLEGWQSNGRDAFDGIRTLPPKTKQELLAIASYISNRCM